MNRVRGRKVEEGKRVCTNGQGFQFPDSGNSHHVQMHYSGHKHKKQLTWHKFYSHEVGVTQFFKKIENLSIHQLCVLISVTFWGCGQWGQGAHRSPLYQMKSSATMIAISFDVPKTTQG